MAVSDLDRISDADRQGPTLNPVFNNVLRRWRMSPEHPEYAICEDCCESVIGKQVHETRTNWVCTPCKVEANDHSWEVDEAYHERQQMGLVDF